MRPRILLTRRWPTAVEAHLAERYDAGDGALLVGLAEASTMAAFGQAPGCLPPIACSHGAGGGLMDDAALARFIMRYERITRDLLATMPDRAHLIAALDADHRIVGLRHRADPN